MTGRNVASYINLGMTDALAKITLRSDSTTMTADPLLSTCEFGIAEKELASLMQNGSAAEENLSAIGGVDELCRKLETSPTNGLCDDIEELEHRRKTFGSNVIPTKPTKSFIHLMWEACCDKVLIVLVVAAVLSLGTSFIPQQDDEETDVNWIEGCAILVSVLVVVFVTAFNNYSKERQFQGLKSKLCGDQVFAVLRGGHVSQVLVSDIVVGDICQVKYGDLLPADGILIQGSDMKVDESTLTGESDQVKKGTNSKDVMLYSGTHIMEGSGRMVVTAVGRNSQAGMIFSIIANDDKELSNKSVLQKKLTKLAELIGYVGLACACLTVVVLALKFVFTEFVGQSKTWKTSHIHDVLQMVITGVTVLVVAVPEGLPLAVTISLSYSVKKMMKDNNLVRHLDACETMGNATTICSDKTGTLTTNRMTVVASYLSGVFNRKTPDPDSLSPATLKLLVEAVVINCSFTSSIVPSSQFGEQPKQVGNKTECALLGFITELNQSYPDIRLKYPESSFHHVYTFNSNRKSMSTVIITEDGGYRMFTKGASENILERCTFIYSAGDQVERLDAANRQWLVDNVIFPMAADCLRTIAVAYKDFDAQPDWDDEETVMNGLTFICIAGILISSMCFILLAPFKNI